LYEWEGIAGKPATKVARIDYDYLHEFGVRQADSAVAYIKQHAKDAKPFFMDVNFMKMHNPNIPAKAFIGKSHLGNYSDAMLELDSNIGKVVDAIRAEAPDTIVIITADNGAWQDAWPDAGTVPFRGEKGSPFEGGFRVPGIMCAPGKIPAGARYGEMMSHIDLWSTLATMVGLTPRPTGHGRTTTASRSILIALTTAPTSWARRGIRRAPRGSMSTVRASPALAPTSAMIPRTPTSISPGNTCILPKTPGSVHSRILVPSARPTTSPWTHSRNTT
jgi:arylsulfatase A-like enzyme